MKFYIFVSFLILSPISLSKTLSCSANGTDVYYINGVLTKREKNERAKVSYVLARKTRNDIKKRAADWNTVDEEEVFL